MAILDYSKGGFRGKVGVHYGEKKFGSLVLQKIPLKSVPQSQKAKSQVRAFEILNRFAGAFAKIAFRQIANREPRKLPHNVCASIFKPLVQNHTFSWSNFEFLGTLDDSCILDKFEIDWETGNIELQARTTSEISKSEKKSWYVFVFDNLGKVVHCVAPSSQIYNAQILINKNYLSYYRCVVFRSVWRVGRPRFFGFATNMPALISGGVWYFQNSENPSAYIIEENTVKISDPESFVQNETLKVR